jgi:hypothetical protein
MHQDERRLAHDSEAPKPRLESHDIINEGVYCIEQTNIIKMSTSASNDNLGLNHSDSA